MALVHPAPGPTALLRACLDVCILTFSFFFFVNSSLIQQNIHVLVTRIYVQYVMTNGPYVVCVCILPFRGFSVCVSCPTVSPMHIYQ